MAIILACGAECRINVTGQSAGVGSVNRHWNANNQTPTADTSIFRTGLASIKCAVNTNQRVGKNMVAGSDTVAYARGYFYLTSVAPSVDSNFFDFNFSGNDGLLRVTTGGVLQMLFATGTPVAYSGTLVANEWYGFEGQGDARNNPNTMDWRIWRASTGWVDQTQVTNPVAAGTIQSVEFGWQTGPVTGPDVYWDDMVIGAGTTIDEDWSDADPHGGEVLIYRPNADGTHSFSTSGDFKFENSTNFAQTETTVWQHLDAADMTQTAEFISQNVTSSGVTKYCEVQFADETARSRIQGVYAIGVFRSAGTQANEMNLRCSDDGFTSVIDLWGNFGATGIDVSETSNLYGAKIINPPSGGAWTQAKLNSMRMRFGMSDDVSPVPFVAALALEVAWLEDRPGGALLPLVVADAVHRASRW